MINKLEIDVLNSLTICELDILKYIDKNKLVVVNNSIQHLAELAYTSTATILRLCKKLGLSGYAELKYVLKEELEAEQNKVGLPFSDYIARSIQSITQTLKKLDEEKVSQIIDIFLSNNNLYFFGKGLTLEILKYVSKELLTYNRPNITFEDTHIAYLNAEKMTSNDCLFVASLSGNTHQVVRMAQIAKSGGAKIIALTGTKENELSKIADIKLCAVTIDTEYCKIDVISRSPMSIILDVIMEQYKLKKGENEKLS